MPTRSQLRWFVPLLVLLILAPTAARAAPGDEPGSALTIGGSFGVSALFADGSDMTVISFPQGPSIFALAPGLRFGHVSASRGFEFGLDTGIQYARDSDGSSAHVVVFGLDIEKHFPRPSGVNLFVGADAGMVSADLFGEFTQPYFGVAIGGRNVIAGDNGSVKFVVRFRQHLENEDDGVDSFQELTAAFAFDLWIPR